MIKYILKDKNKNQYVALLDGGVYGVSNREEDATRFKTIESAKKFRDNCLTKEMRNFNWSVDKIEESDMATENQAPDDILYTPSEEFLVRLKTINESIIDGGYEDQLKRVLKSYLTEVISIVSSKEDTIGELSKLDRTMADIYHYVEMNNELPDEDCKKVVSLQNGVLKKRRICKNRLAIISNLEKIDLNQLDKTIKLFERMDEPKYTPKATESSESIESSKE